MQCSKALRASRLQSSRSVNVVVAHPVKVASTAATELHGPYRKNEPRGRRVASLRRTKSINASAKPKARVTESAPSATVPRGKYGSEFVESSSPVVTALRAGAGRPLVTEEPEKGGRRLLGETVEEGRRRRAELPLRDSRATLMHITLLSLVASVALMAACAGSSPKPSVVPAHQANDLTAARALFKRNIDAIQQKDRAAYLATYRSDDGLVGAPVHQRCGWVADRGDNGLSNPPRRELNAPPSFPLEECADQLMYDLVGQSKPHTMDALAFHGDGGAWRGPHFHRSALLWVEIGAAFPR